MSDTNNFETGYQDDDNTLGPQNSGTANGASTGFGAPTSSKTKAGKKGSKFPLIVFGVIAVLGLGGAALLFLGGGDPAPPPAPTPSQQPADQAQDDASLSPADQAAPADTSAPSDNLDPITGLPIGDTSIGAAPALDPVTGLPVTDPSQAGIPMDSVVPGSTQELDPITGLPVGDASQDAPVAQPSADVDPTTGLPVAAPGPQLAADPLAQFRDLLAPIDGRVTTLEGQVSTLTTRVDEISKRVDGLADRPRSNSVNVGSAPRRAAAPARKKAAPANYVRVASEPRVAPPVSRVVIVSQGSNAHQAIASGAPVDEVLRQYQPVAAPDPVASKPVPSCDLQAIVPGRVWVKNADGSFASYGEGETWNGQTVGQIDPARGVSLGGRWICN